MNEEDIKNEKAPRSKTRESSKDRSTKKPSVNRPFHTGQLSWKHQLLMLLGEIVRGSGRVLSLPFRSGHGKETNEPRHEGNEAATMENMKTEHKDAKCELSSSSEEAVKINSLPYDELAKLGFSQKTVDGWSDDVKNALMNGEPTPILKAEFRRDTRKISFPVKLQLAKGDDGKIRLLTNPVTAHVKRSNQFSAKEWDSLLLGNPLVIEETLGRKRAVTVYQLDPETNSIRQSRDVGSIVEDIAKSAASYGKQPISDAQKYDLLTGKPIEVMNGTQKKTFGIDLNAPGSVMMMDGGLEQWNKDKASRYQRSISESMSQKATLGKSTTL